MSGGILRFPWTSQPQSLVGIDWSNPLSRGLAFVAIGGQPIDLVNKKLGTYVGTAGVVVGERGQAFATVSGAANRIDFVKGSPANATGEVSFGSVFKTDSDTGALQYLINRDAISNLFVLRSGFLTVQQTWNATGLFQSTNVVVVGKWNIASSSSPPSGSSTALDAKLWLNGKKEVAGNATNGALGVTSLGDTILHGRTSDNLRQVNGAQALAVSWNRVLSDAEHASFYANPWQLFAPIQRKIWVPNAGGGGSHPSSGALASSAATIAGTATHLTLHTTSGALAASDATIAGSANRSTTHPTSGALVASDAVIAGAATHLTLHTSSGSLVAGDAELAGAADHSAPGAHTTSGALAADVAVIAGSAAHLALHTSTGALVADSASIAGTALHTPIHAASGGLVASEGALLGIALRTPAPTAHDATGGLVAGAAEIAGLATGPALPFFSVSGGGIKPKHHKKPTPSLFDEELKAPTAKLKKAVVPSFTPSTFVPYAKMGVPKALSKALGEVLVGPLSAPLREVLPPEYDDDDIPDEVIMLALQ